MHLESYSRVPFGWIGDFVVALVLPEGGPMAGQSCPEKSDYSEPLASLLEPLDHRPWGRRA